MVELTDLRQPVNQMGDLRAEVFFDVLNRRFGVFDGVVQQPRGNADGIEFEFGEDVGDFERVDEIRFARLANLAAMLAGREQVSPAQQFLIRAGMVLANFIDDGLEANHCWSLATGCASGSLCLPLISTAALIRYDGKQREPCAESITTRSQIKKVTASAEAVTFNFNTEGKHVCG